MWRPSARRRLGPTADRCRSADTLLSDAESAVRQARGPRSWSHNGRSALGSGDRSRRRAVDIPGAARRRSDPSRVDALRHLIHAPKITSTSSYRPDSGRVAHATPTPSTVSGRQNWHGSILGSVSAARASSALIRCGVPSTRVQSLKWIMAGSGPVGVRFCCTAKPASFADGGAKPGSGPPPFGRLAVRCGRQPSE